MAVFSIFAWGGSHHQVAVVNETGQELSNRRFAHNREGLDELIRELSDLDDLAGVAIDRSEGLLVERLHASGLVLFPVSPRVSARARERYQSATRKNDRFDAFVLADALRTDGWRWRSMGPSSELHAELRAVVRHRRQWYRTQVRVEAQLRETLLAYHPGVTALFSSIDRAATLAFLRDYPNPEAAARVGEARMEGFCKRIGYSGRVSPEELVDRLRTNLMSGSAGSRAGHEFAALTQAEHLALLNDQLRRFNRQIDDLLDQHPDAELFESFPGIGRVTAAELIAEIGDDRSRYPTVQHLMAEAGAAPVTLASGKIQRVRIRYACNRRLRSTTTTWAYTLKRIDPISRQRYLAALDRGKTRHGALRSISASWLRVAWRCWQDNTPYDPEKHRKN